MKDTETCVGSSLASYFVLFSLISFCFRQFRFHFVSFRFVFVDFVSFRFVFVDFVSHFIGTLRVTTYDLRQVTSPIMEVKRYYIVSYILYIINPTSQKLIRGPVGSMNQVVVSNKSYKPIPNTEQVRARLCKLQKGCTRLAAYIAESGVKTPKNQIKS